MLYLVLMHFIVDFARARVTVGANLLLFDRLRTPVTAKFLLAKHCVTSVSSSITKAKQYLRNIKAIAATKFTETNM